MPKLTTRARYALARMFLKAQDFSIVPSWVRTSVLDLTFRSLTKDGYKKSSAFFACVSALAFSIPEPPLFIYDGEGDEGKPLTGHPLRLLLRRPMPTMGEAELLATTMVYLGVGGNAYWHKVRGGGRQIVKLKPYHAGHIIPVPGGPDWIQHYEYDMTGSGGKGSETGNLPIIPASDIVHFKWPSVDPDQPWMSMPPILAAASEVDSDVEAISYIYALLKNDAIPRTVLTVPADRPLDDEEIRRMKDQWRERYGGSKRGEVAILEGGTKVERLGLGLQELGFDALAKVSESRIAAVLRVPPIIAGLNVGLERSTFANYGEARKAFAQDTLVPFWRLIASEVSADLLPEFAGGGGVEARFDLSRVAALQEDAIQKTNRTINTYKAGLLTKNEARNALGYADTAEGGEDFFKAGGGGGGGVFGQQPPAADPAALPALEDEQSPKAFLLMADGSTLELASGAARILASRSRQLHDEKHAAVVESAVERKESIDSLEKKAERAMLRYLRAQYKKAASGVRNGAKASEISPAIVEQLGLDLGPGAQKIMARFYPEVLAEAFKDAELYLDVDIAWDVQNVDVQKVLGELGDLIVRITETTREAIGDLIGKGAAAGWSIDKIAEEILAAGLVVSSSRARMIARTETATAYSMGSLLAYAKSGVVDQVEWLATVDENTCPDCVELNGKTRDLDKTFSDGSAHPPRHPNCRCSISPIVKKV